MKSIKILLMLLLTIAVTTSCDEDMAGDPCDLVDCAPGFNCENGICVEIITNPEPVTILTASDVPADVDGDSTVTHFSLEDNEIVAADALTTTNWDIAFDGTTIYFNSGTSGDGNAQAQLLTSTIFNELETAPTTGYGSDSESGTIIPTGSGNGWYSYTGHPTHSIVPLTGVVIALKTAKGNYAKIKILSYYKGNPDLSQWTTSPPTVPSRYYTFEFGVQKDGSTSLK